MKSEPILFAEWIIDNDYFSDKGIWYKLPITGKGGESFTTEQLYSLFKLQTTTP